MQKWYFIQEMVIAWTTVRKAHYLMFTYLLHYEARNVAVKIMGVVVYMCCIS